MENKYSLIDKVLFQIRNTHRCLSVIRADIEDVRRLLVVNSDTDVVEVCFVKPFFVQQRIAAHEIPLPKTDIACRLHFLASQFLAKQSMRIRSNKDGLPCPLDEVE